MLESPRSHKGTPEAMSAKKMNTCAIEGKAEEKIMCDNGRSRATEQGGHNSMCSDLVDTFKHRSATNEPSLGLADGGLSSNLQRSSNRHGKGLIVGRAKI